MTDSHYRSPNIHSNALRLGTMIWTPTGLQTIEALKVGDRVIAGNGKCCTVVAVTLPHVRPLTRLQFDRGEIIDCGLDHPWLILPPAARYPTRHSRQKIEPNPRFGRWEVATSGDMLKASGSSPRPRRRFLCRTTGSIQMDAQVTPIDPYLLGLLLGDGCLRRGVFFSTGDPEIVQAVQQVLPAGLHIRYMGRYDYAIALSGGRGHGHGGRSKREGNALLNALRQLDLIGRGSADKFVPHAYLNNSIDVRLAILQGLMDTDGSIAAVHGAVEFSTTSPYLAGAVDYLVTSFGGKVATTRRTTKYLDKYGARRPGAESFRVRIRLPQVCPFRLRRKIDRCVRPVSTCDERVIWTIESIGQDLCAGIFVDSFDGTFTIQHGIVAYGAPSVPQSITKSASHDQLR